jgi:hypothetical protein
MRDTHEGYNPELTLQQMRAARTTNALVREAVPPVDRAVAHARGLWPDPTEREAAGFGCLTAAATLAEVAGDGGQAMIINLIGLFGQALVDDARAEAADG